MKKQILKYIKSNQVGENNHQKKYSFNYIVLYKYSSNPFILSELEEYNYFRGCY